MTSRLDRFCILLATAAATGSTITAFYAIRDSSEANQIAQEAFAESKVAAETASMANEIARQANSLQVLATAPQLGVWPTVSASSPQFLVGCLTGAELEPYSFVKVTILRSLSVTGVFGK